MLPALIARRKAPRGAARGSTAERWERRQAPVRRSVRMPVPREIATWVCRQTSQELLAMDVDPYRAAFRGSAMKRAKLRAMKRNPAVVLGNVGASDDVDVLTRALDDAEPLVREHAAWALARIAER